MTKPASDPRPEDKPREYTGVTIQFEDDVLKAMREVQRTKARQFRSLAAFVNYHMAVVVGLETKPDSV